METPRKDSRGSTRGLTWVYKKSKDPDLVLAKWPTGKQGKALKSLEESGDVELLEGSGSLMVWIISVTPKFT